MKCLKCKRLVKTRSLIVKPRVRYIENIDKQNLSMKELIENNKIFIVGMNPGVEENKKGIAFIGRSGKLLDLVLKFSEIQEGEFFITNSVRCFAPAPNNQNTNDEIKNCSVYLKKEIEVFKPKKIILLGKQPLNSMNFVFSENANKFYNLKFFNYVFINNIKIYLVYHPAYILRNQSKKEFYVNKMKEVLNY